MFLEQDFQYKKLAYENLGYTHFVIVQLVSPYC